MTVADLVPIVSTKCPTNSFKVVHLDPMDSIKPTSTQDKQSTPGVFGRTSRSVEAVHCCVQTTLETPDNTETLSQKVDISCLAILDSDSILFVGSVEKLLRVYRPGHNARGVCTLNVWTHSARPVV